MAALFAILLFYYIFDPASYVWMPQCFFHKLTGLQCMGCGSQRAVHALLHGDIASAFLANAYMVSALPFLGFLAWLELSRRRFPDLYKKFHSRGVIITISATLFVWLIIRNIFGW